MPPTVPAQTAKTPPLIEPKKPLSPSTTAPKLTTKTIAVDQKEVEKLLQLVAEGEQDQAEALIQKINNYCWRRVP